MCLHFSGVFSESTARELQLYGKSFPGFLDTARFITFITNIWKIMSVKTPVKGIVSLSYNTIHCCLLTVCAKPQCICYHYKYKW